MGKPILFSRFVDTENIVTNPSVLDRTTLYRYSLMIPMRGHSDGPTAFVIMKNPSNAGTKFYRPGSHETAIQSDITTYRVCDYLYKHGFQRAIILNLFAVRAPTLNQNVRRKFLRTEWASNRNVIKQTILRDFNQARDDRIIAAWGGYYRKYPFTESKYRHRIEEVKKILKGHTVWCVGESATEYPPHGNQWFDFEEMRPFYSL